MLDKEKGRLDAAIIATPDFWHAEHADRLPEGRAARLLRKGDVQHARGRAPHGRAAARDRASCCRSVTSAAATRATGSRYQKLISEAKLLGRITTANGQWNRARAGPAGHAREIQHPAGDARKVRLPVDGTVPQLALVPRDSAAARSSTSARTRSTSSTGSSVRGPTSVIASGGTDYYTRTPTSGTTPSWPSTSTPRRPAPCGRSTRRSPPTGSAATTSSSWATRARSRFPSPAPAANVYRDVTNAPDWGSLVKKGLLCAPKEEPKPQATGRGAGRARDGAAAELRAARAVDEAYHQPHLENFFDAIRGRASSTARARSATRSPSRCSRSTRRSKRIAR